MRPNNETGSARRKQRKSPAGWSVRAHFRRRNRRSSAPERLEEELVTGTSISNETFTLSFKLTAAANQAAGFYSTVLTFSAVALY